MSVVEKVELQIQPNDSKEQDVTVVDSYKPVYGVEDVPPWYLCILLGFQHYLTAFGSTITVPFVLYQALCIGEDGVGLSQLINTIFFMSGLSTLLQTTFGIRLPIIQGATFAFLAPTTAILEQMGECSMIKDNNVTIAVGSDEHREIWHGRLREVQGAIMIASLTQIIIGFSGVMGLLLPHIGPLAIAPTISLIGLALFPAAYDFASTQWYIALTTVFFITLFSQYLQNVSIPIFNYNRQNGCKKQKLFIFKLFPVLLAMLLSWLLCYILTVTNVLTDDVNGWGYLARTDTNPGVLSDAQWFRFPYPGQWGTPTASVAGVFGMLAGVLASMIESVGDYYACAKISGARPPPVHAINRGIGMEGIACVLAGAWGSGNGTTSYSENIGAIGITKVGSRRVVQVGGIIMILLGCLGKFGALFVTIPKPVVGGMFLVMFGMITAVGLSNLQYVDMRSSRNIFILGVSLFFGLCFPSWMSANQDKINTGSEIFDQILAVLLSTSMFVGGVVGFVLDVTIPGTVEERGIHKMRKHDVDVDDSKRDPTYDLPFIQPFLDKISFLRHLPFCPTYTPLQCNCRKNNLKKEKIETQTDGIDNVTCEKL
ncbi:solute carrier family 23 member 2-like isoform X1 [Mytilus trossulus]|uniref:solute carrier family 23 member 2-like isoform X1 n=2 Tax=Mytilus trossulus TaxID=6551 RepID=UPI0030050909